MALVDLFSYKIPAELALIFIAALLFIIFITSTKSGILYRQGYLNIHVRALGLISLVLLLIYSSFFIDRTQLEGDLEKKKQSLELDVFFLDDLLSIIKNDYHLIFENISILKNTNRGTYDNTKLYDKLLITESKLKSLNDVLDGAKSRIMTANNIRISNYTFSNELEEKIEKDIENTIEAEIYQLEQQFYNVRKTKKYLEVYQSISRKQLQAIIVKYNSIKESKHSENIYYAMRALSLGGLGALITLLASYILVKPSDMPKVNFIKSNHYWSLVLGHTLMGAIISIVAFGLFYTKQLSIFKPEFKSTDLATPEYWRVTMLCVIAGAFAEKLYSAASNKVEKYVEISDFNKTHHTQKDSS